MMDRSSQEVAAVRQRYGLGRRYILSVGTQHPRKNFDALVRSFELLRDARDDLDLVIAGAPGPDSERIQQQLRSSSSADRIHLLNWVPKDDLPAIYSGAELFILLAWHEGFGMPALEAMACETPVVAASTGALPEVCGSAARYVHPADVTAIANVIGLLLANAPERLRMSTIGLAWSQRFRWDRTARTTLNLLRAVRDGAPVSEERLAWSDPIFTFQEEQEERHR